MSGVGSAEIQLALQGAPARAGRTRVLAIDGRSGAGKTRLAAELSAELGAAVVSLEDLYGGWDGLERGIDLLVSAVLEPFAAGRAARVPRYDWAAGSWAEPLPLEPPDVLIVEGVGAGARRAARFESLLAWLEAPADVRKKRALDRDGKSSHRTGTVGRAGRRDARPRADAGACGSGAPDGIAIHSPAWRLHLSSACSRAALPGRLAGWRGGGGTIPQPSRRPSPN